MAEAGDFAQQSVARASTVGVPVETTKQRLLREAATLMGRRELAQRLKVSDAELDEWISGTGKMPDRKLLVLAEVLDSWAGRQNGKPAKSDLKPAA